MFNNFYIFPYKNFIAQFINEINCIVYRNALLMIANNYTPNTVHRLPLNFHPGCIRNGKMYQHGQVYMMNNCTQCSCEVSALSRFQFFILRILFLFKRHTIIKNYNFQYTFRSLIEMFDTIFRIDSPGNQIM